MEKLVELFNKSLPYIGEYSLKLLLALVIFFIGKWISKRVVALLSKVLDKSKVDITLQNFLQNLVYYVLMIVVLMAAASSLGIDTTSFLAILGTAGLAIGLALKDSLSNFAAGVMIILLKPFRIDDVITVDGNTGKVKSIAIFNTVLLTPDNRQILVPNGNIVGNTITNVNVNDTRRVDMVFGIGYDDDISKAKAILNDILSSNEKVLKNPAFTIALVELADSSVNFAVRPWVKTPDYWDVYFAIHEQVKIEFDKANISIPYPQRDVHIYNQK